MRKSKEIARTHGWQGSPCFCTAYTLTLNLNLTTILDPKK